MTSIKIFILFFVIIKVVINMEDIILFPSDTYKVFNKAFLNGKVREVLIDLYQPIIGTCAISLYLTLLNDLNNFDIESPELTHQHLVTSMQVDMKTIEAARDRLEGIGLLQTLIKKGQNSSYIYQLYSPISPQEFFKHPMFSVVLMSNVGKEEYQNLVSKYRNREANTKEFTNITKRFSDVYVSSSIKNISQDEIIEDQTRKLEIEANIDLDLIIDSIPKRLVNDRCFTESVKELIVTMAYLYKLGNNELQTIIRNSVNEKGSINKEEFQEKCRTYYQFENNGKLPTLIYNRQPDHLRTIINPTTNKEKIILAFERISPIELLTKINNGVEPSDREKKIVEDLLCKYRLTPGVVNVLIDYTLKTHDMRLNKEYMETIASQFNKKKIETVREAMDSIIKTTKKNIKTTDIKKDNKQIPDWMNKKVEISNTNDSEIEDLFKDFE